MVISTCSFGSTGSSAVSDYLRECDDLHVIDSFEFVLSTCVDGLEDLEYHLMKHQSRQESSIYAIQRFEKEVAFRSKAWHGRGHASFEDIRRLTDEFLDGITQVKYIGNSPKINKRHNEWFRKNIGDSIIRKRIITKLEKKGIIKKNINFYPLDEVRVSIRPDNFYECAQKYVEGLFKSMGVDASENIVLDQAFSGNDPAKSFPFFKDPYAIVVDRDPRDVYIFARKKLLSKGRFMPSDNVDNFIKYYRALRENQPYKEPNDRILLIRFEEMVYDYENTVPKIDKFLGVKNVRPKTIFIPEMSAANTNLIRRFPEFQDDIKKIEQQLPEYIFRFEDYPEIKDNGKMFFGRSLTNPNQAH
jgi:hypothetical protein